MKLLSAIIVYLLMGALLGYSIVHTMTKGPLLMIIVFIAYFVVFGLIGCLPKKSH
jgi:hypothetical protein